MPQKYRDKICESHGCKDKVRYIISTNGKKIYTCWKHYGVFLIH